MIKANKLETEIKEKKTIEGNGKGFNTVKVAGTPEMS